MEDMMKATRRFILSFVLALLVGGMVTNAAYAFHCSNPNINDNALVGVFDIASGTFTPTKSNWGSFDEESAQFNGAWVKLVFPWGDSFNVFVKGVLPDGAMNAGPGDNLCDGRGIDDLDACLAMPAP